MIAQRGFAVQVTQTGCQAEAWRYIRKNSLNRGGSRRSYRAPALDGADSIRGHVALVVAMRQMGPSSNMGPSDLRNTGASPPKIQTLVSGGCLPMIGATTPATP